MTYTCLITDDRYAVPTLSFYIAADEGRMRQLAKADLETNPNHRRFEVRQGDQLVFVERRADPPLDR